MSIEWSSKGKVLLRLSDVEGWRTEREDIARQIASLQERASLIDKRLEAASLFLSDGDAVSTTVEATTDEGYSASQPTEVTSENEKKRIRAGLVTPVPMPVIVYSMFTDRGDMRAADIVQQVKTVEGVGGPDGAISNNVYTALKRLVDRGKLMKNEDGTYRRVGEAEGALNGHAVSAPNAEEGHHPSLMFNPSPTTP